MSKRLMKILSVVLVLVITCNILPLSAMAQAAEERAARAYSNTPSLANVSTGDATVVEEVTSGRTEYSKEYRMSNGLHMAAVYPSAVHYEEDGQWLDIDNTLKSSGSGSNAVYTNTAGIWDVSFPQQMGTDSRITVTKNGYTLGFQFAGEVHSNNISADDEVTLIGGANNNSTVAPSATTAQVQQSETYAQRAEMRADELAAEQLHSRLIYPNVYGNTNISYDLVSNQLKESVIIQSYDDTLRGYSYTLDAGQLIPVLDEDDGHIDLYDKEGKEIVMTMPAPFMVDDKGEYNDEIQVTLQPQSSRGVYTLSYSLPTQWLAEESRAWPVVLDPVISATASAVNIEDQTVFESYNKSHTWSIMQIGRSESHGLSRVFMRYVELPALSSADVIVDAKFKLSKPYGSAARTPVEIHLLEDGDWTPSTVNWQNQPAYNKTVEDFAMVQAANDYYYWHITDIVRSWYAVENTGMVFKVPDSNENSSTIVSHQFYSSESNNYYRPYLTIMFRNNKGLEAYWDYTSASAGRAGTGYINDYTGNLVWTHSDIGFGGNLMPVSISHVYNANDNTENLFGMGNGWRTNFNQRVYQWESDSDYYVWEDSDGTDHYFYYKSTGKYLDEDNLNLTLTTTGTGDEKYAITDKYGNVSYFDTNGRLTQQKNNQATPSSINITYTTTSGDLISTVTDGAGRVYSFTYSSDLLSRISYKGKGSTELSYVSFTYSGSDLTRITNADGNSAVYTYTGSSLLASAADIDGYKLCYEYTTTTAGLPSRVSKVTEYSGTTAGGELSIEYAHNQTTFTDVNGHKQIMQFNNWGNTVSIQDEESRAQFARYATDASTSGKANQLDLSSKLQNTVGNLLSNNSFENGNDWTASGATMTVDTTTFLMGKKALKVVSDGAGAVSAPAVSVPAGKSLTLSAWVYVSAGSAYLSLTDGSTTVNSPSFTEAAWTRLEVNYTNNGTSAKTVTPYLYVTGGTAYMDNAQLEYAATASRYNLIENGDFRSAGFWTNSSTCTATETRTTIDAVYDEADEAAGISTATAAPNLDSNVYNMSGAHLKQRSVSQTVAVSGAAGDTYVIAGWAKGDAAPFTEDASHDREFGIRLTFNNTNGTTTKIVARFNPDADSSINWQYSSAVAVATKAYKSITVELVYDYNVNSVIFDGVQLFKEEYGNSYVYDSYGNITSVKDIQGQTTTYEYANNDLTKQILPTGAELTYTYDSHHNVLTATSEEGVLYNFAYDAYGNNTEVSIVSGSVKITSTATYTDDYNRTASVTDAAGNTTQYNYDENTNVLHWVQYPEDTEATRTSYTYDNMYRIASTSTPVSGLSEGTALTVAYTYYNDNLTGLANGATTYTLSYGDFSLTGSISIGNRTLASYSYTDDRNFYLASLDYGNGDSVDYTYDDYGRVVKETFEDGSTVTYKYDNSGALATVTDSKSGRSVTYYYDFTDRLMRVVESGDGYSHSVGYEYDDINNLTKLVETINGVEHSTSYAYDDDNRLTSITNGDASEHYVYDAYSRVTTRTTKNGDATLITDSLTYNNPTSATTTAQVATQRSLATGYDVTYSYTYDDNGNILTISDGTNTTSYVYDTSNQLVRENNQAANKTWTWTYDNGGNITARNEYSYTTGELGTPTDTVNYTYDATWGDLLTGYDGSTITSDAIGNMLSDGTWTYTWQNGRELASMTDGSSTWNYTYDADGMRISRTNGTDTYSYVYNGGSLTRMTKGDDTLVFAYAEGPMTVTYNGTSYYYITNMQGDVIAILDANGAAVVRYSYDAWGNILSTTGDMADTLGAVNPLRYRGYVYDTETGLYYLQSRYYDAQLGRFICADDPSLLGANGDFASLNLYAYCGNNPVLRKDSGGTFWNFVVGAAVGAVVSAITTGHDAVKEAGGKSALASGKTWAKIGISAVCGAINGAVAASTATVFGGKYIGAATGFVESLCHELIDNDGKMTEKSWNNVAGDTISGYFGGIAGGSGAINGSKYMMRQTSRWARHVAKDGISKATSYYYKMTSKYSCKYILPTLGGIAKGWIGGRAVGAAFG